MELDMIGIGERIKTRRKELKLSQTDIYERCDITSGALSKIENGKTTPSVIAFYKLSQVLECDMNWLATGISSNMQKSNICKLEEELLNGFRELPEDDKEELMGLLQLKLRKVKKERDVTAKSSGLMGTEMVTWLADFLCFFGLLVTLLLSLCFLGKQFPKKFIFP